KIHVELSRLDTRKFQKIVSQARQASGMVPNDFDEVTVIFLVFEGTGEKRFSKTLNRGERSTEFVGNVGDEVPSHLFEAAKVRNFVEDNDGSECLVFLLRLRASNNVAERSNWRNGYREIARLRRSQRNLTVKSFFAGKRLADQFEDMSLPDHFYSRLAFDTGWTHVPDSRKCFIAKSDALAGIDHGDTLHHAAQNCSRAIAFLGE